MTTPKRDVGFFLLMEGEKIGKEIIGYPCLELEDLDQDPIGELKRNQKTLTWIIKHHWSPTATFHQNNYLTYLTSCQMY